MAVPAFDKSILAQDIASTEQSIELLEQHVSRLRELIPQRTEEQSESRWAEISAALGNFFSALSEQLRPDDNGTAADGGQDGAPQESPWSALISMIPGGSRSNVNGEPARAPTMNETTAVIDGIDDELSRLRSDLRSMQDRLAADGSSDSAGAEATGVPATAIADDELPHRDRPHVRDDTLPVLPDLDLAVTNDGHDENNSPKIHVVDTNVLVPGATDGSVTDVVADIVTQDIYVVPDVAVLPSIPDTDDVAPAFEPGKAEEMGELDGAVYDVGEILGRGKSVADLKRFSVPPGALKAAGVSASDALAGGYSAAELKEGEYGAFDVHGVLTASAARDAGFQLQEMHGIFSAAECADAFSAQELAAARFTVHELQGVLPLLSLRGAYSAHDLRDAYGSAELREAGFSASDLAGAGFDWSELASAGFNSHDLSLIGAPESSLRELFPGEFGHADNGNFSDVVAQDDDSF